MTKEKGVAGGGSRNPGGAGDGIALVRVEIGGQRDTQALEAASGGECNQYHFRVVWLRVVLDGSAK